MQFDSDHRRDNRPAYDSRDAFPRRHRRRSRGRGLDAARPSGHRRLDAARSSGRLGLSGPARSAGRDERPARGPGPAGRPDRRGRQSVPDPFAGQVLPRAGQAVGQQVRQPQEHEKMARPIAGGSVDYFFFF